MGVLLLIFLLLLVYARKQDQRDVKRRNIIYVDDNDPRHRYAYLVTVYTGVQYKAGTSAHVAMFLTGEKGSSNTHLLTGEKKRKRTLERGSDSWFLITTHGSLGDLTELHIWHDNSGSNPEWFLERVLVRDCQTDSVWVFLVGRWVHPVTGLLVTVRPAALHEVTCLEHVLRASGRGESPRWTLVVQRVLPATEQLIHPLPEARLRHDTSDG
ncbi:Polycystic kidney disease protein 1-like 2 [Amphibalanus amphitrite]|uniref:Polycystic kidney disease protein 1-like 2 n=1 Tax=Amphibalanus amphitrite TaxID=1232801 RepID=A0A6A4WBV5_AMPAM|nr:Polycystic kidney disease protein 1-like 2 [Amphibalanus amphitrite]